MCIPHQVEGNFEQNIEERTGKQLRKLGSMVNYTATGTLEELSVTLRSLKEFLDTLDHQPQALLFGKENKADE